MSTSPAGSNAGQFQLCDDLGKILVVIGVPGNARQRRLYVRRWKRQYTVMQFNCETRAPRFKR
jgi:hypothetical protein